MKTSLRKLISEIDFTNEKLKSTPDWENLATECEVYDLTWSEDERLTSYYIRVHCCTDSWVGIKAYFLDGEFVAISNQSGRKCPETFEFVSTEIAMKVRDYLLSLIDDSDDTKFSVINDMDDEIEDTFSIEYSSQILHKSAVLNGETVKIIKTYNDYVKFHEVVIEHTDGKQEEVDCRELRFKYNTIS